MNELQSKIQDGRIAVYSLSQKKIVHLWPVDAREQLAMGLAVLPEAAPAEAVAAPAKAEAAEAKAEPRPEPRDPSAPKAPKPARQPTSN